eukprot:CAMPEP_0180336482 /NCGR_PEP_ID=MMETSP0988-20121125/44827_1 /TAXON_ID=697907 /ORGANISM="non described non described, Strain CCMP2293" /LENGTH=68 /DNA_ID=CAMNT_0022324673 /DNA_START=16 /DNA_END=220 /DNA_ORIENTATION=-
MTSWALFLRAFASSQHNRPQHSASLSPGFHAARRTWFQDPALQGPPRMRSPGGAPGALSAAPEDRTAA